MKRILFSILVLSLTTAVVFANSPTVVNFTKGKPAIESIGALAFGPNGILFIGDSQSASIFAIELGDPATNGANEALNVPDIDEKIAALLGTTTKDIRIHDLAVNPVSHNAYLSVTRGRGNSAVHVLLRVKSDGSIEEVSLENVTYSKGSIPNPVSKEAKSRRGASLRSQAITDLAYADGKVYIAGLSNEEFSSSLRVLAFPFTDKSLSSSLEIYHGAHGRYETNSPIRTFLPYTVNNEPHMLAAYTCTPLVTFPMSEIKDGKHVKGKTVAELGSGNRPLDMIAYENNDKKYLLIANSNRTLMKIDPEDIEKQKMGITDRVEGQNATEGVKYIAISQVGIQQVDNLDSENVLVLQRMSNGSLNLRTIANRRL